MEDICSICEIEPCRETYRFNRICKKCLICMDCRLSIKDNNPYVNQVGDLKPIVICKYCYMKNNITDINYYKKLRDKIEKQKNDPSVLIGELRLEIISMRKEIETLQSLVQGISRHLRRTP